jgi:hypothetical protein
MSRTFSADSQLPAEPQSTFSFDPESKALEPLAPTRSREVLGTADISPVAASIIPILDRQPSEHSKSRNKAASRFDKIHWKYAKFAFLCTVVLFITWVCFHVLSRSSGSIYGIDSLINYYHIGTHQRQPSVQ